MKYYHHIPNTGEALLAGNLVDVARYRARYQPDGIAYAFMNNGLDISDSLTYSELHRRAQAVAHELGAVEGGTQTTASALLLFSPGLDFIVAFWACLYAGVTAVPAYPIINIKDMKRLAKIVEDSGAQTILTSSERREAVEHWFGQHKVDNLRYVTVDTVVDHGHNPAPAVQNDLAFLQYTSGSTGNPKGVMVSHENLLHNLYQIYTRFGHDRNSIGVIWLPPYHDMGLIGGILQPLYGGFPVYLMSPFTFIKRPLRWLEAISRYGATTSGGPNFAYQLCAKHGHKLKGTLDLSRWKVAFCGAEPIRKSTMDQFNQVFADHGWNTAAFYPCYGLAESTLMVSGGTNGQPACQVAADPQALSTNVLHAAPTGEACVIIGNGHGADAEIIIVDADTREVLDERRIGEIWVKGDSVAQGYWNNKELTIETFRAITRCGKGPYLRTGDLGTLVDNQLYVTGRIKELVIVNGRNFYPTDIEACIQDRCADTNSGGGAAFSVSTGHEDHLVLVQEIKKECLRKTDLPELLSAIAEAVYDEFGLKVHDVVLLAPGSIPKTSSGKIKRREIKLMYQNNTLVPLATLEQQTHIQSLGNPDKEQRLGAGL